MIFLVGFGCMMLIYYGFSVSSCRNCGRWESTHQNKDWPEETYSQPCLPSSPSCFGENLNWNALKTPNFVANITCVCRIVPMLSRCWWFYTFASVASMWLIKTVWFELTISILMLFSTLYSVRVADHLCAHILSFLAETWHRLIGAFVSLFRWINNLLDDLVPLQLITPSGYRVLEHLHFIQHWNGYLLATDEVLFWHGMFPPKDL